MATGDVTISIAIEGGVAKSAVFDSDTRVKVKAYMVSILSSSTDLSVDANWQIYTINDFAQSLINYANKQAIRDATPTPKTFTAAS